MRSRKGSLAALLVVVSGALGQANAAAAPVTEHGQFDCQQAAAAQVNIDAAVIERACNRLAQERGAEANEVPTLFMAWPTVGFINDAGEIGYPVSGVCIYASPVSNAQLAGGELQADGRHTVVGSAQAIGPAESTTVTCTVDPAGLSVSGTLIGPTAVASTSKIGPLGSQVVCVTAVGRWLDGSPNTRSSDCSPAL